VFHSCAVVCSRYFPSTKKPMSAQTTDNESINPVASPSSSTTPPTPSQRRSDSTLSTYVHVKENITGIFLAEYDMRRGFPRITHQYPEQIPYIDTELQ
jgi:hypothetical protein